MKSFLASAVLIGALAVPGCAPPDADSAADDAADEACEMLFVQQSAGMAFDGSNLTLKGAGPNIIFFCDRPVRTAGHMTREVWLALVSEGENTFASNPPNAAVSVFGADGEVAEAIVELAEQPVVSGEDMIFGVRLLEGTLPEVGGPVAMFVDPIGRPLSPTSRAGVHRRHRRRAVRRH
jgi:hypothetical protein